ncbi:hypothetical protein [Streptomyces sp. NPDC047706]|uniref:hypothetical protein n=1 Tax=Streptomyces sp. NPDC047706 TaxID=3365486 RepID=UPI00371BDC1C
MTGSVTTLALRSHLYDQLDGRLGEAMARAVGRPPGGKPDGDGVQRSQGSQESQETQASQVGQRSQGSQVGQRSQETQASQVGQRSQGSQETQASQGNLGTGLAEFVTRGPQPSGTIAAEVHDGTITDARVGEETDTYRMSAGTPSAGGGTGGAQDGTSSQITSWVEANFKEVTVGSATFHDLTRRAG